MKKKKEHKYFLLVNTNNRSSPMWVIATLSEVFHKYPHLEDKIDVVGHDHIELNTYILVRSI